MDKKNPKLIERARSALLSVMATAGDKQFRRSAVVAQMLESRRDRRFGAAWAATRKNAEEAAAEAMKQAAAEGAIARSGHQHWVRAGGTTRKLLNGTSIAELATPVELTIQTSVPTKWLVVDCETGEVYQGTPDGKLKRASKDTTTAIRKAIR